ncbi:MAG: prepilin-type N-terminal cleavage/methylation domain-containing protein [Chthonomonadales bacterium]
MKRQRGNTLIEMLVSCLCALVVGAGLLSVLQLTGIGVSVVPGQNLADKMARIPMDTLCDNLRNAQVYATTPSCFQAASSNSISLYTNTTGTYARFYYASDTHALKKTLNGVTTTLIPGCTALTFTYYVSNNQYSPGGSSWVTTANPNAPTATELSKVASVGVVATFTTNGYSRTLKSFVRLRNSPPNVN